VDRQCGKLVTVVGHKFIALTVDICVQHGGRKALRRAGLSAAAVNLLSITRRTAKLQQVDVNNRALHNRRMD